METLTPALRWALDSGIVAPSIDPPDRLVTRGEFASSVMRFCDKLGFNVRRAGKGNGVADVPKTHSQYSGCDWVIHEGLMPLDENGSFFPDDVLTGSALSLAFSKLYYEYGKCAYNGADPLPAFGIGPDTPVTLGLMISAFFSFRSCCLAHFTFVSFLHKGVNVDRYFNGYIDGVDQKTGKLPVISYQKTHYYAVGRHPYRAIREFGFDHIRLPIFFRDFFYIGEDGLLTPAEEPFSILDEAIRAANACELRVVLDFHALGWDDHEFNEEPSFFHDDFVRIWSCVAARYRDYDPLWLGYEIFNEPHDQFQSHKNGEKKGALWNRYQKDAYDAIRAIDREKTVAFATIHSNLIDAVEFLDISYAKEDHRILLSIHNYVPHSFTMIWGHLDEYCPNVAEQAEEKLLQMLDYQKSSGVPIWHSEFGVWRSRRAEEAAKYYEAMGKLLRGYGIPFCLWDLDAFSDAFDNDTMTFRPFIDGLLRY